LEGSTSTSSSTRCRGSLRGSLTGGASAQLEGRKDSRRRTSARQDLSSVLTTVHRPDRVEWGTAPPSCSVLTSSPVTARTTSGPVMNILEMPLTMKMKSVMAGL
jgi:hypothetical protein